MGVKLEEVRKQGFGQFMSEIDKDKFGIKEMSQFSYGDALKSLAYNEVYMKEELYKYGTDMEYLPKTKEIIIK